MIYCENALVLTRIRGCYVDFMMVFILTPLNTMLDYIAFLQVRENILI